MYVPPCHEESPLGEGTWHILHKHKASKRVKHFKCNFESGSAVVIVCIKRVLVSHSQTHSSTVLCNSGKGLAT